MLDFLMISTRTGKKGLVEVYPKFIIKESSDLMIRGGDFYAIWMEEKGVWSTNEDDAFRLIDIEIDNFINKNEDKIEGKIRPLYMWDSTSGSADSWHKYCQKQMRDHFHALDKKLIFLNDEVSKKDYASKRLPYPLEPCDISNYETLISTLYDPEERDKIEWAIGAILTGDSKYIQKFMVLYGESGAGKSTILNVMQKLFEGYFSVFDARALGTASNQFALEAFKTNPLLAIQHDGDLSRIEDNTRLNSLVSHEFMTVNEKFKSTYQERFESFLIMGTNKPVKITDAKSGLTRRLIDVIPSGRRLSLQDYNRITKAIDFELGGIACHCIEIYREDPIRYDDYIPYNMISTTNDFYNFMLDSYFIFKEQDGTTLKAAWEMYRAYCEDAQVSHPLGKRAFKSELANYFNEYDERLSDGGDRIRSYYSGFKIEKFKSDKKDFEKMNIKETSSTWIEFKEQPSYFDDICKDCFAQYANDNETPSYKWDNVKTILKNLNTRQLHYVRVPENHIVIDFDIPDVNGEKSFEKNLAEASKWPATYAELSKSGKGIHLHYIYTGDVSKLSRVYDEYIEVKIFTGNSSLRRKLTLCNDIPVANISSGLPLREESKMVNFDSIKNEKAIRTLIKKNLNKEIHANTKPSIDFIFKILEDAYNNGVNYDVSDMMNPVLAFAAGSSHQSDYCVKLVSKMHFKSEEPSENKKNDDSPIIFLDVEVFPNLFLINYKIQGKGKPVVRLINPTPQQVEEILSYKIIGYNTRRYDNHILYARLMGYTNEELFKLSQRIVNGETGAFFSEAYNLSYTDVYDYCAKKQSLKKWEIELGIRYLELGLPWDQPVPEDLWDKVAEYCDNDVYSLEAVWDATQGDFAARKIQVDLVKQLHNIDACVNDTTNALSQKILFGRNKAPQAVFNYRNLAEPVSYKEYTKYRKMFGEDYTFRIFDNEGLPVYRTYDGKEELPDGYSILPFFPGYKFEKGVSTYLGEEIGEGGKVYAEPGMYTNVLDLDVSSMHPSSIIEECLFGPEYTKRFKDIKDGRVAIKHKNFKAASEMLEGALTPYLNDQIADDLAQALKIVINSIYGLTSAKFPNAFRDDRNIDNIVAKRGALFMTLLKQQVQKQGFTVAHIKTDSIKIPNATEAIKQFVIDFGREYGYNFEIEAEFSRFCLVNDAVYVAMTKDNKWTATGTQFQVPYVFKTLFSHEKITFEDKCELKSVKTALYLDFNESLPEGEHNYKFIGKNGIFCPVKAGAGGGTLYRIEKDGRYSNATGAKGYRWMESEVVKSLNLEKEIDESYYKSLVDDAVDTICQFGDFEQFVAIDNSGIKSDPLPEEFEKITSKKEKK